MNIIHNNIELEKIIEKSKKLIEQKVHGEKKYILICGDSGCVATKSLDVYNRFIDLIEVYNLKNQVEIGFAGCFGLCSKGPFVKIYPENTLYKLVKESDVEKIITEDIMKNKIVESLVFVDKNNPEKLITHQEEVQFYQKQVRVALFGCGLIDPNSIEEYFGIGGYSGFGHAITLSSQDVIDRMKKSGLRGRGGGGFPTGNKWQFALNQTNDEKYVICNADEGDPGAFMDRSILEGNPHSVIEGMLTAGYAIGANQGFVYVRAEYPKAIKRLQHAIEEATKKGLLGKNILDSSFDFTIEIRFGAGAFVCGEETALIASIEGKRGMPTAKPPFPAVKGLWGKPTIINNVETLANIPFIMREGGLEKFLTLGSEKSKGTKVFALAGKVNNIGLVEVPMGTTLRELIFEIGGGIPDGKKFKAIQTGGPSGGCLTEDDLDTPIDFDNLLAKGSMMGSGGAIVMDEDNCMVDVARFYLDFICEESCGKCNPCKIGTTRLLELIDKIIEGNGNLEDLEEMEQLGGFIKNASLCGLGQSAPNPILSTLEKFKAEYRAHVVDKICPAKVCKQLLSIVIMAEKCKKCGLCSRNCPVGCISGKLGKETFKIDKSRCTKCELCLKKCPFGAIVKV